MTKTILIFAFAALFGLVIQATVVHSLYPAAVAPDFILILVVFLGLQFGNVFGLIGAFLLGVAADFASGKFLCPHAAGCIVAFLSVILISRKVYADHFVTVMFLTFFVSIAKGLTYMVMLMVYVRADLFNFEIGKIVLFESMISAVVAPVVMFLLSIGPFAGSFQTARRGLRP